MKCEYCGIDVFLPFRCPFCNRCYCTEHRLPENHECSEYWRVRVPREEPLPIVIEEGQEAPSCEYTISYMPPQVRPFGFSSKELRHLTLGALLVIGVGLSYIPQALRVLGLSVPVTLVTLLSLALIFTFSFLLHEIAHKLSAQHFGMWAEFRLTLFGALITLLSMLLPFFKIISPGAVMVAGPLTREEVGKTALAGPLTNLILSTICIAAFASTQNSFLKINSFFGALINAIIALFNLIPFGIMDGFKVFQWNKLIWTTAFIASLSLAIFTFPR